MPDFTFTSPDNKQYTVSGPDGATKEQAFQILQSQLGASQPPAMSGKDQAIDIAKGAGSGLAEGTMSLAGMPGDIGSLMGQGVDYLGSKVAAPDKVAQFKAMAKGYLAGNPLTAGPAAMFQSAPTTQQIGDFVKTNVGELPQPETTAGKITQTAASFVPSMIGGPESLATKALTRVIAPTIGTEAAGALSGDNPYARMAGAVAGGVAGLKGAETLAARSAAKAAPTSQMVKDAATGGYDALTSRNVATPLAPGTLSNVADDIRTTLNQKGIRPSNAGSIHAAVNEIESPATAGAPDVADLVAFRQNIKDQLGKHDTNKAGAYVALNKIEQAIEQNSPGTMADLRQADKNYAGFKASESLDKRVIKAEDSAAGANSGLNFGNRVRQKVEQYLNGNEAKYLSAENKDALQQFVKGTVTQNTTRLVSNLLGGGGGIGATALGLAGAGVAGEYSGHPELAAIPLAGLGTRMAYNRMMANAAKNVGAGIRSRSPLGMQMAGGAPALPQTTSPQLQALISALLGSSAMQPVNQVPQYQR